MRTRSPIGYVVEINHGIISLNLLAEQQGQVASHFQGITSVGDVGSLLAVEGGERLYVFKVTGLKFSEPREVHSPSLNSHKTNNEPLRQIHGSIIGWLSKSEFTPDSMSSPTLGAQAFPLSKEESALVIGGSMPSNELNLGRELRTGVDVTSTLNNLLAQHVAVLGSSGQGKTGFTAAILQQLAVKPNSRIVVFDINGEYDKAFRSTDNPDHYLIENNRYKQTVIGGSNNNGLKIPYYALGREGLARLLLPSEKTQRPALSFAIKNLPYVEWDDRIGGARLMGGQACLFDDCRSESAQDAAEAITSLREGNTHHTHSWPHMSALGPLIADSYCLARRGNVFERNSFQYGNISPLITRLHRLIEDPQFNAVVDVESRPNPEEKFLSDESKDFVGTIFGTNNSEWNVHVVNLKMVPQDLMPLILGSVLELYAQTLFQRGQGASSPTLLVLEEAHHYLRPMPDGDSMESSLAYERLAKEGRKFGLSLWLSTQRPSEVSPTVLSQCNTWVTFKLNSEKDLNAVSNACEWADRKEVSKITGLPRQHAIIFGGATKIPTYIKSPVANPPPDSSDGNFDSWIHRQ